MTPIGSHYPGCAIKEHSKNIDCEDSIGNKLPLLAFESHSHIEIGPEVLSEAKASYRVPIDTRFDLVPPVVIRRLAAIYEEGARKYGPSMYLEKPLPNSVIMNHLMNHINLWWSGDRKEDHLAKAIWGLATIITLEEVDPNRENDLFVGGVRPNASE